MGNFLIFLPLCLILVIAGWLKPAGAKPKGFFIHAVARHGGVKIYVETYGRGETTVLLIHGFNGSVASWKKIIPNLNEFHVVAVDLMGFGRSEKPLAATYSLDEQGRIVSQVIEQLCLNNPVLVGDSLGGNVALEVYGITSNVGGLVLISTPDLSDDFVFLKETRKHINIIERILNFLPPEILVYFSTRYIYPSGYTPSLRQVILQASSMYEMGGREAVASTLKELLQNRKIGDQEIDVDSLLIWSCNDEFVPLEHAHRLLKKMPKAKLKIIGAGSHSARYVTPHVIAECLRNFAYSLPARPKE